MPEEFEATPGRLDRVAADRLRIPRADVQRAIALGRVSVDGRPRPKSFPLAGGERVVADIEDPGDLPAEGPGVPVRYEDDHLLVVAKPPGIPTHPVASHRAGTLVNRLLGMGVPLSAEGGPERPGIVHRLDSGTSGLLIVAKDDPTHLRLQAMFRAHAIARRYLALVRGSPPHDRFAVDAPLARRRASIVVRADSGRVAETWFDVRERLGGAALLEATPRTGRTHQIRVHLSSVGHPILGDRRYGGGGDEAKRLGLERPFLHSWRLSFEHPVTGTMLDLEERLPADLEAALEQARRQT